VAPACSSGPTSATDGAAADVRPTIGASGVGTTAPSARPAPTTSTTFLATTSTGPAASRPIEPATCAFPIAATSAAAPDAPPTSAGPSATTTTTTPQPDGTTPAPPDARAALARFSTDPRVAGTTRSVSIWMDGIGEVASENPDQAMIVASNQKLLTALGALRLLDPNERLHTDLVATGPVEAGVLHGDLVVVAGGDPTLTRTGDHSLETLAKAVADVGIHRIDGRLLVDDSRYDAQRSVDGWTDDWPRWVGPLSAFSADHNQYRKEATFLRDPALGNAELLQFALTTGGIAVTGGVGRGTAPSGVRLASIESATVTEIVTVMLFRSDNFIAEMLLKELGYRHAHDGRPGTTAEGLVAVREVTSQLCTSLAGADADGSGFSTADRHSARELRRLLLAAQLQPWGPSFTSTISLAGQPDALGGRLDGPRTAGNVRAKGGSLSVAKSLSGYLRTASGRNVVFSIVLNNGNLTKAEDAIDDFVTNLASLRN